MRKLNSSQFLKAIIFSLFTLLVTTLSSTSKYFFDLSTLIHFNNICIFIFLAILIYFMPEKETTKAENRWIMFFSIFVVILNILGSIFHQEGSLMWIFSSVFSVIIYIIKIVFYSFVTYKIITSYYRKVIEWIKNFHCQFFRKKNLFIILFIIFLICWIPYFIVYWPGVLTPDANESFVQFFGDAQFSWTIKTIKLIDPQVILNNHQPVFYTLFIGLFAYIGRFIHHMELALSLYTIFQMTIMALIFSYMFTYMKKQNVPDFYLLIGGLFIALCPIVPYYMITWTKDVLYTGVMILATIFIHRIIKEDFKFIQILKTIFIFLLLALLRNNGFYILLISFILLFIFLSKKRILCIKIFVPVIAIYMAIVHIGFPLFHITEGSPREMYSVVFQQLARAIKENGDSWMSTDEKECVEYVLQVDDVKDLPEYYNPQHADSIKGRYNVETDDEMLSRFLKVWAHGFIEYPVTYLDSFFTNTYPYYSLYSSSRDFKFYYNNPKSGGSSNEYYVDQLSIMRLPRRGVAKIYQFICKAPVTSLITTMGFSAFLLYFGLIQIMMNKKYKYLFIYLFAALNYLISFLGPVAYYRYGVPFAFLVPLLLGLTFKECWRSNNTNEKIIESNS